MSQFDPDQFLASRMAENESYRVPEETGNGNVDVASALKARYGQSLSSIFAGLGGEMGLNNPGVPTIVKEKANPFKDSDAGEYSPSTHSIYIDNGLTPDQQAATLAHELTHAANQFSGPQPIQGDAHLTFDTQDTANLSQIIRQHMGQEEKDQASSSLSLPWQDQRNFADGGSVEFDPDAFLSAQQPAGPEPKEDAPVEEAPKAQAFDPDKFLYESKRAEKFGSDDQQTLAGIENLARSASLGLSDLVETKLIGSDPEEIRQRKEEFQKEHPYLSFGSSVVGGALPLAITGGAVAPLLDAGVAPFMARVLGFGAEGAGFGAGNALSDYALGDPNLNANKVAAHIGFGALLGSGLGLISHGIDALPSLFKKAKESLEIPGFDAIPSGEVPPAPHLPEAGPAIEAEFRPVSPGSLGGGHTGVMPTDFVEMANRIQEMKAKGFSTDLPSKALLQDAIDNVRLEIPITPMQMDSLSSKGARDSYKTRLELPGDEEDILRGTEAIQKQDALGQLDRTISDIFPNGPLADSPASAGKSAAKDLAEVYSKERSALSQVFNKMKDVGIEGSDQTVAVVNGLVKDMPALSRVLEVGEDGAISLKPNKATYGIDQSTYRALKEAIQSLPEAKSLEDLVNIRRSFWPPDNAENAPPQIQQMKASLMSYMESVVDQSELSGQLRNTFKKWALNEKMGQFLDKSLGIPLDNPNFEGSLTTRAPEDILNKIFRNSSTVDAARSILGDAKFNEVLANFINLNREASVQKGNFLSNKFAKFLNDNSETLSKAFNGNPKNNLMRIQRLNRIMQILPDDASINPSGTAKTLLNAFRDAGSIPGLVSKLHEAWTFKSQRGAVVKELSNQLSGKSDTLLKLDGVGKIIKKSDDQSNALINKILRLSSGPGAKGVVK